MKRLSAVLCALLALSACAGDTLDGTVTSKDLDPGYTYVQMQPINTTRCQPSGPNGAQTCYTTVTGYIPITIYVPPCYRLYVKSQDGKKDDGCVDEDRWMKAAVGTYYQGKDLGKREREQ